ncbi:MAG: HEAT repeat domain-containing protein [Akkermansiaceae bacterium]|nr:HEAT repeat domain-containing protein [Akkermansiaceae bacterium]
MRHLIPSLALLPVLTAPVFAASFELKDGDRVAFLGDALIEREQYEGWVELAFTTQFPDRNVTFRNLGWNADTPAGDSRNGLSLLQAGLEPPEEGWRQLQNQLTTYKPNVIVLGYGMASSLVKGGTPEQFQKELDRLLDDAAKSAGNEVRIVVLGAPPRFEFPGIAASEAAAHRERLAAFDKVLKDTAAKRSLPFVALADLPQEAAYTQNGIHLTGEGYKALARHIEKGLGWKAGAWDKGDSAAALRRHILKKNEWFFNRSRPANMAYIFGFRKKEQGNNAKEIPQFDALIAEQEAAIAKMRDLSKNVVVPDAPVRTESAFAKNVTQPHPNFTVAEGYEITLWAENPLLHKPTQMNFDPSGKLWVASSETYPQVEVGQTADDKIIVLSDSDGDGKADKSSVFADGMLMPTAVLPGDGGVYVGQSTDLLHFKDTDGDGKADVKTRVLSGFGTEDTHHNIHTLRRGPDGRLWFNQSIYTRTDTETPHGVFRLKSGGIMRFDPRDSKIEPVFYGWCNPWGHQFDKYGQSFVTDGAGGAGINWGVPGAMYFTFAKAPKILGSISPGSYPKFSGLEIVESAHFPADWQGNMITCDFRAHRIVRFGIADQGSGYAAQELGDLVRTDDVNFRPIDAKIGPDGALYIADWSNPIINHGEVDFRDPRRDREHGRIWRITKKGGPVTKTKDFTKLSEKELLESLVSDNRYDRDQATAILFESKSATLDAEIGKWSAGAKDDRVLLAALWLQQTRDTKGLDEKLLAAALNSKVGEVRAAAVRVYGDSITDGKIGPEKAMEILAAAVADDFARVRIEAIRALSKVPGAQAMDLALKALDKPTDRFIDYALWLNIQEHGEEWLASPESKENAKALEFVLGNLPPSKATAAIAKLFPKPLPKDGSGPWLALGLKNGDATVLTAIYDQVISQGFDEAITLSALRGLGDAVSQRQIKPAGDGSKLLPLINGGSDAQKVAAISLAGATVSSDLIPALVELSAKGNPAIRGAAINALGNFPAPAAKAALVAAAADGQPADIRSHAVLSLAKHHRDTAVPLIAAYASGITEAEQGREFWQKALSSKGISKQLAAVITEKKFSPETAVASLQHIPDVAEHDALLKVLREQAGSAQKTYDDATIKKMAAQATEKGDAARGEAVYRRPALACTACHAIGGAGGKVGPDMTSIGASAPMDYLIESVVNPGAKVKEGYHSVIIETKDGKAIMGQLIRSGGSGMTIRDGAGQEIVIPESNVAKKTDAGSLMPGNLIAGLPENDVNDLFKFLSQLGKPGDYDATKSKAPKVWAVLGLTTDLQEKASAGDPSLGWTPVTATVNGRLLPEDVAAMAPSSSEIMAGTKLQLSEAAKIQLTFADGFKPTDIWINGKSAPSGTADLQPGIHKIVVRAPKGGKAMRMTCESGTFLPEW